MCSEIGNNYLVLRTHRRCIACALVTSISLFFLSAEHSTGGCYSSSDHFRCKCYCLRDAKKDKRIEFHTCEKGKKAGGGNFSNCCDRLWEPVGKLSMESAGI